MGDRWVKGGRRKDELGGQSKETTRKDHEIVVKYLVDALDGARRPVVHSDRSEWSSQSTDVHRKSGFHTYVLVHMTT